MYYNKAFIALVLVLLCTFLCTAAFAADEREDAFVVATVTEMSGMFFTGMWGNDISDIDVRAMLHNYSPVIWSDQTSMELNPIVVRGISVGDYEDGNRAYVIQLQKHLKFSDGSPIKARDYVFSLMLQASPLIGQLGGTSGDGQHIMGYEEYFSGASSIFSGISLVDEYTYMIEVKAEWYPYFYELSFLNVLPYPMDVIAPGCEIVDDGEGCYISGGFTVELLEKTILDPDTGYRSHPYVTSRPYRLVSFDRDTWEAVFEINEHFLGTFDGVKPSIEPIRFISCPANDIMQNFEDGNIQVVNRGFATEMMQQGMAMVSSGAAASSNYPRMGLAYINFACDGKIFKHEAVRKAVAYSLDTEELCHAMSLQAIPVYGYMGVGQWLYTAVAPENGPPFAETDEEIAAWSKLTLDGLNKYEKNLEQAEQLLIDDGWTLNAQGEAYVKGVDTVRHKMAEGELVGLSIKWGRAEDSPAAALLEEMLPPAFAEIGMELVIETVTFQEVLMDFYRQQERRFDMHMLASNVSNQFDPSADYALDQVKMNGRNVSGIQDEHLAELARAMRETTPGDLLEYATRWVAFQEYWNEVLPMLPLYSNIYFDFFVPELTNYRPEAEQNWPEAIVKAHLAEAGAVDEAGEIEEEAEIRMFGK